MVPPPVAGVGERMVPAPGAVGPGPEALAVRPMREPKAERPEVGPRWAAAKPEPVAKLPFPPARIAPVASMAWPANPDWAMSARFSGRFQTASLPLKGAATAPAFPHDGWSQAEASRSRDGPAAKLEHQAGSATAGGAAVGLKTPPSAALGCAAVKFAAMQSATPRLAACRGAYRCLSRNTPCSPKRLANREKRRHGARRPPSSAASHRSTT